MQSFSIEFNIIYITFKVNLFYPRLGKKYNSFYLHDLVKLELGWNLYENFCRQSREFGSTINNKKFRDIYLH